MHGLFGTQWHQGFANFCSGQSARRALDPVCLVRFRRHLRRECCLPLRRPWWLKLVSANLGWLVNELPFHALAANAVMAMALVASGTLDERPTQVAILLTITGPIADIFVATGLSLSPSSKR